jgi:hypothetical protein
VTQQLNLNFDFPDHDKVSGKLDSILQQNSFELIVQSAANKTLEEIKTALTPHSRTGETIASVHAWEITKTNTVIKIGVGSQSRGQILKWLDQGRGPVKPVNRKCLRWLTHPDQVVVFAKYARATKALNFMQPAAISGLQEAEAKTTQLLTE